MDKANSQSPSLGESHWSELVRMYKESGLSRRAFCRHKNLKDHCLAYWVRKLELKNGVDKSLSANFIDLSREVHVERSKCVELEFANGMILRVRG